jgi:hypothetical protein
MGILDKAVPISELGQSNLWVIYGKSGSGKTNLLASFPKPLLYLQIGDDGSNTIGETEGIDALRVSDVKELKQALQEARIDGHYKTVAVDTFSLLVNDWVSENAIQKNKRMTQQMWGDLKTDTEELIKSSHILAKSKIVVLTCHEVMDTIEGYEDEITPDVRPSLSKGARTYLESMANFGIHTAVVQKEKDMPNGETKTVSVHIAHLSSNPYYWVKTQKPASIQLPEAIINPSYAKIKKLLKEGKKAK